MPVFSLQSASSGSANTDSAGNIVTHAYNSAGNLLQLYDPVLGVYLPMDFLVVTDEEGNVITA